ncbi:hypothetical protein [Aeromonas bestiarum]|uniref:hypothetical protein n=1 Tax=Aeromonas bestiarum TaxID=105751 RepID=UPI003D24BF2D
MGYPYGCLNGVKQSYTPCVDYIDRKSRSMNFNPLILNESVSEPWQRPLPSGMGKSPQNPGRCPLSSDKKGHLQEVA